MVEGEGYVGLTFPVMTGVAGRIRSEELACDIRQILYTKSRLFPALAHVVIISLPGSKWRDTYIKPKKILDSKIDSFLVANGIVCVLSWSQILNKCYLLIWSSESVNFCLLFCFAGAVGKRKP